MIDQVMSSASNILAIFAMARVAGIELFGAATLAFAILTAVLATSRGLIGTPISLLADRPRELEREIRYAATSATLVGLLPAALLIGAVIASEADLGLVAIGVAIPITLAQDAGRFYWIAAGRPHRALISDTFWATGSLALLTTTWADSDLMSFTVTAVVWTGLALMSLLLIYPWGLRPGISKFTEWLRPGLRNRLHFGAEAALAALSSLVVVALVTAILGLASTAALRGASTTMGPLSVLMGAIPLAVIPELRRRVDRTPAHQWATMRKIALGMSLVAVAIGAVALVIPASLGELILGESWTAVRVLLPITAIEYVALAWVAAATAVLRAQVRSAALLQIRVLQSLGTAIAGCGAALIFGSAEAVALGFVVVAVVLAWASRRIALRIPGDLV